MARGRPRTDARRLRQALAAAMVAFLVVVAVRVRPVSPQLRVPRAYQLAALIEREQGVVADLRRQLGGLRADTDRLRRDYLGRQRGMSAVDRRLDEARAAAGLSALRGPALQVSLDDATGAPPTSVDVNDLVIHSQDVQAVVNALWRAGAEAVAVNGQRLVSTSAVLCVGNTLLLDGTVSSPPYVAVGIGAAADRFQADPLVRQLASDATTFGLHFDVTPVDSVTVPGYGGPIQPHYAAPVASSAR